MAELLEFSKQHGPLGVALLIIAGLVAIGYRLIPRKPRAGAADADAPTLRQIRADHRELTARMGRAEKNIRDLTSWSMEQRRQVENVRVDVATIAADVRATREKLEDLCERVDRSDVVQGARADRIEGKLDQLLLGRGRA
jgi:septal ring factor EnvC (AmiA/AmiB activator)